MQSFFSLAALAASAAAWTVDLRNNYEDNHTIYVQTGETLEVLVDGIYSTGYRWISNVDFEQQNNDKAPGHIDFIEEEEVEDAPIGFYGEEDRMPNMGARSSYRLNFTTQ